MKLSKIKIDPEKMGHIEKGISQPYFGIIFGLLITLLTLLFIVNFIK